MAPQALVLDAQPVVAYFLGEQGGVEMQRQLERARNGDASLLMTAVNAGEVLLAVERRGGADASHRALEVLQELPIRLVTVDLELAARAAWFKVGGGISYADAFAAALAHREGIPVLTGDREFEPLDRVKVIGLT